MRVSFTPRARADIEEIADFTAARSPQTAARVRSAIVKTLELLAQFPGAGRRQTVEGVRKLPISRYPYLVYYTIDDAAEEVVILTIRHASRRRVYEDA
jgi:addiction module RelE/StbE family toxin